MTAKPKQMGGKIAAIGAGLLVIGGAYWMQIQAESEAQEAQEVAEWSLAQALDAERETISISQEIEEQLRERGCENSPGSDKGAISAAETMLERFADFDPFIQPERKYMMPDEEERSMAGILAVHMTAIGDNRAELSRTLDRVCSASGDKDRMDAVVYAVSRHEIHEAYLFVPFVESSWCDFAVSPTGPRGMMQFTRGTAEAAWKKVDSDQADIPPYDFTAHRDWLLAYAEEKQYGSYSDMLSHCSYLDRQAYQAHFYPGADNPKYPRRIDPRDPRTEWGSSTKAAVAWLKTLDSFYLDKGFSPLNAIMLALAAYNQGSGEVQRWIVSAMERYGVEKEAALSYAQVYAGALDYAQEAGDAESRRQIEEGMNYGPRVMAYYLYAAEELDERGCR
jgi:hypothetical protein